MSEFALRLSDGTRILVPASLRTITTYVLLEQEAWFEKEAPFIQRVLKPGISVIDIGANIGVYSLPLARRVGPQGAVFAYEPGAEPRRLLEQSAALNGATHLHIIAAALSDRPRAGYLEHSDWSELQSLTDDLAGESIRITSLDEEDRVRDWPSPDFVKIDAEGEELRILQGGHGFFARHSPLVMFEIKTDEGIDYAVADGFRAAGYAIFRLLAGAPMLVPVERGETLDPYELNLFAAKPDRAAALAAENLLVSNTAVWSPGQTARADAMKLLAAQAFGAPMSRLAPPPIGSPYRDALAAYAAWRSADASPAIRWSALRFAFGALKELCGADPQIAWLSTFARVAWEAGERETAVAALRQALEMGRRRTDLVEPFWPVNPRFDRLEPGHAVGNWFLLAVLEQLEKISSYSSCFGEDGLNLDWLRAQPFVSTEIERRYMLKQLRAGRRPPIPERLCRPADDHINFDIWRSGAVLHSARAG